MGAILWCRAGVEKATGNPPLAWLQCLIPHRCPGRAPTPGCPFLRKEWVEREAGEDPGRCSHSWQGGGTLSLMTQPAPCPALPHGPPRPCECPHLPCLLDSNSSSCSKSQLQVPSGPGTCTEEHPGLPEPPPQPLQLLGGGLHSAVPKGRSRPGRSSSRSLSSSGWEPGSTVPLSLKMIFETWRDF